ncbi:condensation domain-containing protein [Massilia sp. H-1]|nr:condensation domain-containing protein [Massilia sp. H-1]
MLRQCCATDDVVFGTVLSGRLQGVEGADQALGLFINTLPIRLSLADLSAAAAVDATYARLTELLAHEQAPLALAQRCSGVQSPLPLFTTLLNYRHSHVATGEQVQAEALAWDGVRTYPSEERTNYPVTLSVDDLGQGFGLNVQCLDLDPLRLAAMLDNAMASLTAALLTQPDQAMRSLAVLLLSDGRARAGAG